MKRPRTDAVTERAPELPSWMRVEGTLMSVARTVRVLYDSQLDEIGLNLWEASVLGLLATSEPLTQVELARLLNIGRARAGVHIDALESKGAVLRALNPADRRVWMVSLTDEGQTLWRQSVEIDRRIRSILRRGMSAAERDQLDGLLARMHGNAEKFVEGQRRSMAAASGKVAGRA